MRTQHVFNSIAYKSINILHLFWDQRSFEPAGYVRSPTQLPIPPMRSHTKVGTKALSRRTVCALTSPRYSVAI